MARINFETEVWQDSRFQRLLIEVGDRHRAIGMVIDLWTLAQQFWCPRRELIPLEAWGTHGMPAALLNCGLVESRETGLYAKGSEEHFEWWFGRQAAGRLGGLASAAAKRSKGKQRLSTGQAELSKIKQLQPSSSSSSSKTRKNTVDPAATTLLWDYYSKGNEAKGLQPVHEGGKTSKLCKRLVDAHDVEKARQLVDAFLADQDAFVSAQAWSLGLLASQQQKYLARVKPVRPKAILTFGSDP